MFLATTALTEFWDTSDEILLLGPWCLPFVGKQHWSRLRLTVAPSPWEHQGAVAQAEVYCRRVIDGLIPELAQVLNEAHGLQHDERYWRIVLGPWLLYYVHALYDRYVSLTRVFDTNSELRTVGLRPSDFVATADTRQFVMLCCNDIADWYNLQLYSQVLAHLKPEALTSEVALPAQEAVRLHAASRPLVGALPTLKRGFHGAIRSVSRGLARMIKPQILLGGVGLSRRDRIRLMLRMARRDWAFPILQQVSSLVRHHDEISRKSLVNLPATNEFTTILVQTLPMNFPTLYLEGYRPFQEACLAAWPHTPAVIFSTEDWYFNEIFKVVAAEHQARGTRLVGGQHGGGYGISEVEPFEQFEISITDRWISWGWVDAANQKVRPLSRPFVVPIGSTSRQRTVRSRDILIVATSHPRYPYRFAAQPVGRFDEVLVLRNRFLVALPERLYERLIVRLNPVDYGWRQLERLREVCPQLRLASLGKPLREEIGEVSIVVVEYLGTSYLEILAANVPAVLFWNPDRWALRSEAEPFFSELRRAEILWDSPEEAAKKVAEVYNDPWAWWNSAEVQGSRRAFVDHHALEREDWVESWVRMLGEEAALSRPL